jgi:hypothetical protein
MKNNSYNLFVRNPTGPGGIYAFRVLCVATVLVSLFSGLGLAQDAPSATISGSGTTDFIPIWTNSTTLGNSGLFQLGTGAKAKVGIATTTPASTLDVNGTATVRGAFTLPSAGTATAATGSKSRAFKLTASAFNSTTSTAVNQTFQWQAEPAGNDTSTPSGTFNLLFGEGSTPPSETGLNIASNGQITFAPGQTFPGTGDGTVTSVGSGVGLIGGPITTSGTLAIDPTVVPQLNKANTFTGNQTVNGNLSVVGGGVISVGGSRALSCTLACGAIGTVANGSITYYGLGTVAAPAGYSLTGCSAFWASSTTCGTIQYPATANITALADANGACHALGYNGSGGTLVSCACATGCELP